MSFYQHKLEQPDPKQTNDDVTDVIPLLISLERNIQLLKRKIRLIGSNKDSIKLRDELEKNVIPEIQRLTKKLEDLTPLEMQDKFIRDFEALSAQYKSVKSEYESKAMQYSLEKHDVIAPESVYESMPIQEDLERQREVSEETPLLYQPLQKQEPAVSQDELDFHTIIQQERSQDITKIHTAVQEVNAIFKQLGTLVQEQGEQVDSIGENVTGLSNNLQTASKELNRANEYQRKKNRCGTIALVAIIMITLIALLAILS